MQTISLQRLHAEMEVQLKMHNVYIINMFIERNGD